MTYTCACGRLSLFCVCTRCLTKPVKRASSPVAAAAAVPERATPRKGKRRERCLCERGRADICPVHAPGVVERRILGSPLNLALLSGSRSGLR